MFCNLKVLQITAFLTALAYVGRPVVVLVPACLPSNLAHGVLQLLHKENVFFSAAICMSLPSVCEKAERYAFCLVRSFSCKMLACCNHATLNVRGPDHTASANTAP